MPLGIAVDHERLVALCRRHHVERLELFGSHAKGLATNDSDVDLLVTFAPGQTPGLDFFALELELADLLACPVDLITRRSVERSFNPVKRASILDATEILYDHAA
jgi:predicted nucleotidyltransferase